MSCTDRGDQVALSYLRMSYSSPFLLVGSSRQTVRFATVLIAMLGAGASGCGARGGPRTSLMGVSESYPESAEAKHSTPTERDPVQPRIFDPTWLDGLVPATDQPQISQGHHPPAYQIEVLITAEGAEAYRAWSRDSSLPLGTWLVARHKARDSAALQREALPLYYMRLTENGWQYGAATADGRAVPVAREVCQDCHTQARSQAVFGPPQPR